MVLGQRLTSIPNPVSKPTFGAVQKLKNRRPLFITFDLETILDLVSCSPRIFKSILWHIFYNIYYHWHNTSQTCFGSQTRSHCLTLHRSVLWRWSLEKHSLPTEYFLPKIPIDRARGWAGNRDIVCDGTSVFAHGSKVAAVPIREALSNFLQWLSTLKNCEVILVAHNGRLFDFRVLSNAVARTVLQRQFLDKVSGFTDSLSLIRSKHKKLEEYIQIYLAKHFCNESYSAHDALEDVKMLSIILSNSVSNSDLCKAAYDSETHFIQEISLILQSLCISHLWMF